MRINLINDTKRNTKRKESVSNDPLDWLKIWEDSETYFDGSRDFGYGGYSYDGRWRKVVDDLISQYGLTSSDSLLDIGCAKGFLVNDFNENPNVGEATGLDISMYALIQGKRDGMRGEFFCSNCADMPFNDNEFNLIFCKDSLHNILNLDELIKLLHIFF